MPHQVQTNAPFERRVLLNTLPPDESKAAFGARLPPGSAASPESIEADDPDDVVEYVKTEDAADRPEPDAVADWWAIAGVVPGPTLLCWMAKERARGGNKV